MLIHHNYDPTLKHRQTWSVVPSNQACAYSVLLICNFFHPAYHQISTKLRYITIKESVHSISTRFCQIEGSLIYFYTGPSHWFFLCLILMVISWTVSSMYAPLKYCCVGTDTFLNKNPILFPCIHPFYFQIFTIFFFFAVRN